MHRETLIAWLKDAHAMETGLIPVLQNHAKDARDNPDASSRITQHIQETRRHADLLSDCIRRLGEKPSGAKDLAGRVTGWIHTVTTAAARDETIKNALAD